MAQRRRSRRPAYVMMVLVLLAMGGSITMWLMRSGILSYWNSPEDWRGAPVVETTLRQTGWRKYVEGGAWRNLPFQLSAGELRDLARCQHLAARRGVTIDGVNQFARDETIGPELEAIVRNRPGFFYGEYVLGRWYEARGEQEKGEAMVARAYRDAPVVLVQRYTYPDGSPAAGLRVQSFAVEHNRVKQHSLDPSLVLGYWDLVTDSRGCIYVPAYETVYRVAGASYPEGRETEYPKLGWFYVRGKVGELPVAVVKGPPAPGTGGGPPTRPSR